MAVSIVTSIPACGYLRMSSDKQEHSPAQQRREIERYASQHGYSIVRWYQDDAISGDATEKRTGFQSMHKAACGKRDFDVILVWDLDRFGRFNSIEAGYWVHPLVKAGVRLVTVSDGPVDWLDFSGRLLNCIKQEGKHQFLIDLSRNTTRGLIAAAKAGRVFNPPYGYRLGPDGRLAVEAGEAAIVRRIFNAYLLPSGSLRGIADGLNADCIPTSRGCTWAAASVKDILIRRKYTGAHTFGINHCGKYHVAQSGEVAAVNGTPLSASSPIVLAEHHPAIVDAESFDAVQARLAGNRKQTSMHNRTGNPYLLSGMVRCGCCGSSMTGTTKGKRRLYVCCGHVSGGSAKCSRNVVHEDGLVDAVVGKIRREYLAPERLDKLRADIRAEQAAETTPSVNTDALRRRLADLDRKVESLTDKIVDAPKAIAGTLYGKLERLQADRDALRQELASADRPAKADRDRLAAEADIAIDALWELASALEEADPADLRDLLRTVIERIELQFKPGDNGKPVFSSGIVNLVKSPTKKT